MNVLLVEDETAMADALAYFLRNCKFSVDVVYDGESGLEYALTNIYDAILLDIMLPGMDGLTVLKKMRDGQIDTPVILLTARGKTSDKVEGLNLGADDYLAKPFASEELLARINALNRRRGSFVHHQQIDYYDIHLNLSSLVLTGPRRALTLTAKESALLELLILRREMISSKENLIERLWGYESNATSNNVEVYVSFLRKKLNLVGSAVKIQTVRGIGYRIDPER